ncbi:MAG TPA: hypothetical protein VEJ41_08265 [Candidatus Acidoferrales bacterium]|nr:hypothetical protein [Candidatus Acidoferrales bacterium]
MIQPQEANEPSFAVRKALRLLRRPSQLARDPLAQRLRDAFGTSTCREALLLFIDRAFADDPAGERLRDLLVRCDVQGQKARAAAAEMHLSVRQFFRWRAAAIEALAVTLQDIAAGPAQAGHHVGPFICARCGALQS